MAIPIYKLINIDNSIETSIQRQLEGHQFSQVPTILDVTELSDQFEAITHIENFLLEKEVSSFPYPTYIVTKIKNYHGEYSFFESIDKTPSFYWKKLKQLNARENKILQKNYLKQKNLENTQGHNFQEELVKYAKGHKVIFNLIKEIYFLESIQKNLEAFYDK